FIINKRNNGKIKLHDVELDSYDTTTNEVLSTNKNVVINTAFPVRKDKPLYQPYWLENPHLQGSFIINNQQMVGKPENDADYLATFTLTIDTTELHYVRPVQYKYADATKGEVYEPVHVIAPFTISAMPGIALVNVKPQTGKAPDPELKITLQSNVNAPQLPVVIEAKQKDKIIFSNDTIINAEENKQYLFSKDIKTIFNSKLDGNIQVSVGIKRSGTKITYSNYLRTIHYDHIPDINYNYIYDVRVITEEIKTVGKNIGYITGAGDKVPQALQQMGYTVKLLGENDITPSNLAQFDAVIAGIRAYNLWSWLPAKYDVLMNYIKTGGNYIVQYDQQDVVTQNIGPYPFNISRTRVTDETADVHLVLPKNSVLNYPNKIANNDFLNWIQERSIYEAQNFDAHYAAPIGMHDPNEPESNGSLIIAQYGKGNFVYTGLVFFRELPAGNAGAYRLLANLIALPKNK
ncbi:MAG: PIG-L family deacetylase, partial [Bacteroidota bacterium]|nr:PIG-L family deacetylase [Bacteroidota bacterium]